MESHKSIPVTCSGQTSLKFSEVVSLLKKIESPKRALHVAKWLSVELANVDGKMDGEDGWMDGLIEQTDNNMLLYLVREAVKPLEVAVDIAKDWKATAKPEVLSYQEDKLNFHFFLTFFHRIPKRRLFQQISLKDSYNTNKPK